MDTLKKALLDNSVLVNFDCDRSAMIYATLFTNEDFLQLIELGGEKLRKEVDCYYIYNTYNNSLPIKNENGKFICDEKYYSHPLCGVNWIVVKKIAELLGGRLPFKSEMDFITKNISDDQQINTKEMYGTTNSVKEFPPDKYGLYDISGNVAEWCEDSNPEYSVEKLVYGVSWNNDFLGNRFNYQYKWEHMGGRSL